MESHHDFFLRYCILIRAYVTHHCSVGNFTIISKRMVNSKLVVSFQTRDQLVKEEEEEQGLGEFLQQPFQKLPIAPICKYD